MYTSEAILVSYALKMTRQPKSFTGGLGLSIGLCAFVLALSALSFVDGSIGKTKGVHPDEMR